MQGRLARQDARDEHKAGRKAGRTTPGAERKIRAAGRYTLPAEIFSFFPFPGRQLGPLVQPGVEQVRVFTPAARNHGPVAL